jgi:hypothetical protein
MGQRSAGNQVSIRRFLSAFVAFAVITLMLPGSARAGQADGNKGWEVVILPYLWALSLNGTVAVKGQKSDVDMTFGDILDNLNIAAMANLEVRKGRFGVFASPLYSQLEDDASVETDTQPLNANVTVNMFILEFGVNYRFGPYALNSTAGAGSSSVTLRPFIGGRYTSLDGDINIKDDGLPSYDGNQDWIDPVIGVHSQWDITRRWNVTLGGSIGGFGVGTQFAWSALGLVGYRFNFSKSVTGNVLLGYRALYQNYDTGTGSNYFEWDTTMYGPILGLSIGF